MRSFRNTLFGGISIFILAMSVSTAPLVLAQHKAVLKVGAVLPLSGPQAVYGEELLKGAEVALEILKEQDADLAMRIIIIKGDDESSPAKAEAAARRLVDEQKVNILLGSVTSFNSLAIANVSIAQNRPLVTASSTNPMVTRKGPTVFRTCFVDPYQGFVLAKFASETISKKTAAILREGGSNYGETIAKAFTGAFTKRGGKILVQENFVAGTTDFSVHLKKIQRADPDVILLPTYFQESATIIKQARAMKIQTPFLGGDDWSSQQFITLAGPEAAKGNFIVTHFSAEDPDPLVQVFVAKYKTMNKDQPPSTLAAQGFDAMRVIIAAFQKAQTVRMDALLKALTETRDVQGVMGRVTLNRNRDAIKTAAVLETTEQGFKFRAKIDPLVSGAAVAPGTATPKL